MNKSMIGYILGGVIKLEALFFLVPILTGLIYREKIVIYFVVVALGALVLGSLITHRNLKTLCSISEKAVLPQLLAG